MNELNGQFSVVKQELKSVEVLNYELESWEKSRKY